MKNNLVWSKTVLTIYRYLDRVCGAIDKIIMQSALASGSLNGMNYYFNNTFAVSKKIIELSQRKVTLINLKILIDETLSKIDEKDADLLIEKFFDGAKFREIMQNHNFSMRTTFRKIDAALCSFSTTLQRLGFGDEKFSSMLEKEGWIKKVFQRFAKGEDFVSDISLAKAASCAI